MAIVARHETVATSGSVTADEFLAGPERPGVLLIDGEVFVDDATHRHQRICLRILFAFKEWLDSPDGFGEVGYGGNWVMAPRTVLKPDVWWMSTGPGDGPRHDGPPDLAIEVLSPGTRYLDLGRKQERYREAGLRELWIVDHRNEMVLVRAFERGEDAEVTVGETLTTPMLPGLALDVTGLLAP